MHRSGTSAVTGALAELGVHLGSELMPGKTGENDGGFFEIPFLEEFHDRVLASLGRTWDDPRPLPADWADARGCEPFKSELRAWLKDTFGDRDLFAVKDPRLSLLLPLWLAVLGDLGIEPAAILMTRHRVAVAESLRKRDGLPLELGGVLIAGYLMAAERETRALPRALVPYEELLANPVGVLDRVGATLGVQWPRTPAERAAELADILDPSLCHNTAQGGEPELSTGRSRQLLAAMDFGLEQLGAGEEDPARQALDQARLSLEDLVKGMDPDAIAHASRLYNRARQELRRLESTLDERAAHLQAISADVAHLRQDVEEQLDERTRWLRTQGEEIKALRERLVRPARFARLRRLPSLAVRAMISPRWATQRVRYKLRVLRDRTKSSTESPTKSCEFENLSVKQVVRRVGQLAFEPCANPDVSIVIPVYGKTGLLVQCLESISRFEAAASMEILLIDDASPDPETAQFASIPGLTYMRNESNLGFVDSCNRGAREAQGEFLVFLNSDTQVTEGWLDRMLDTFSEIPNAGLVGSKLLYPDGTLQEAGGIVWQDGSAWNYGKGERATNPDFNHARRVDYCSGACLAIPRNLFVDLGLFDLEFAPGYYEDADLAFRVRQAGREVWYQPAVTIYHVEGASAGRDESSGMKRFQVRNRDRFLDRWRQELQSHRPNGIHPELERDRGIRGRVLFLDHRTLTPDQDSGSVRTWNLLRILRDLGQKVTFLPENLFAEEPYTASKLAMGIEVVHAPHIRSVRQFLRERGHTFDVVIVSRLSVASRQLHEVKQNCPQARILYDTVDLHFLRLEREAEVQGSEVLGREARETRARELALCAAADATLVVSPFEEELLGNLAPAVEVHVVSNVHEIPGPQTEFEQRSGILFVGGFEHPANADAVTWFAAEVVPILTNLIPDFVFHVVGSKPTGDIFKLQSEHVMVHGHVADLLPLMESCRLSVAPLRFGAGVKGKINQSLAHGLPCVATTTAVEGMGLVHGTDVLVAGDAQQMAELIAELHGSKELWERLSTGGIENTHRHFSFDVARAALEKALKLSTQKTNPSETQVDAHAAIPSSSPTDPVGEGTSTTR